MLPKLRPNVQPRTVLIGGPHVYWLYKGTLDFVDRVLEIREFGAPSEDVPVPDVIVQDDASLIRSQHLEKKSSVTAQRDEISLPRRI